MGVIISQLTPYSCVLSCFESYLHDLGIYVTQADMLANHRDLCHSDPAAYHTYGAVDPLKIPDLAARYLLVAEDFNSQAEGDIDAQAKTPGTALLALCHAFGGQPNSNHCIRIRGAQNGEVVFSSPAFRYGYLGKAPLVNFFNTWQVTLKKLRVDTKP
jgi:hypothetical protein